MLKRIYHFHPSYKLSGGNDIEFDLDMSGACDEEMIRILCNPRITAEEAMKLAFGNDMPTVSRVKTIYAEGKPIGVKVYFADGTDEKAICEEADRPNFNLDFGITICLCKKLMGGSSGYNKKISEIHEMIEAKAKAKLEEEERIKAEKAAKHQAKLEEARKKREAREREIEIRKEAYLRAMREFQEEGKQ